MRDSIDVTKEYLQSANAGIGKIILQSGYYSKNHEEEIQMAEWLRDHFGGDITLLAENGGTFGAKRADFEWNGRYWELKTVTSERSIDSTLRKAIGQIFDMPGGVILDFGKNHVRLPQIESAVKSRIEASCRFKIDIIIICAGKLQKVIRYA